MLEQGELLLQQLGRRFVHQLVFRQIEHFLVDVHSVSVADPGLVGDHDDFAADFVEIGRSQGNMVGMRPCQLNPFFPIQRMSNFWMTMSLIYC